VALTPNPVSPLSGNKFYALVGDGAATEVFTFLCVAITLSSKHSAEVEDAWAPDCADPSAIPTRTSAVKGLIWDLSATGICDPSKAAYVRVRTSFRAGTAVNVQLMKNLPGASGGEVEHGSFLVREFTEEKSENGLVKFSCTFHGNGKPTVTVNA
jgi:hypothetical protein